MSVLFRAAARAALIVAFASTAPAAAQAQTAGAMGTVGKFAITQSVKGRETTCTATFDGTAKLQLVWRDTAGIGATRFRYLILPATPASGGGDIGATIDGVGVVMGVPAEGGSRFLVDSVKLKALRGVGATLKLSLGGTGPENGAAYQWSNPGFTMNDVIAKLNLCQGLPATF